MIKISIPDHLVGIERTRFYQREYKRIERQLFPERCRATYNRYSERHRAQRSKWQKQNRKSINANRRKRWQSDLEESRRIQRIAGSKTYYRNHERNKIKKLLRTNARRTAFNSRVINASADAFYLFVRSQKSIPCYYCGNRISGKEAHIDHVIAVSRHGNHAIENLCASCPTCNLSKNARLPSQTNFNGQPLLDL